MGSPTPSQLAAGGRTSPLGDTLELSTSATDVAEDADKMRAGSHGAAGGSGATSSSQVVPGKANGVNHNGDSNRFRTAYTLQPEEREELQDCFQAWGQLSVKTSRESEGGRSLEEEIASLSRCLNMMKEIREKQREYLRLLKGDP